MRWHAYALLALALSSLPSCKERSERVAASYSSVTKPSPALPASADPRAAARLRPSDSAIIGLDTIPVEESYEERAEKSITDANLEAKVSELEKELGP